VRCEQCEPAIEDSSGLSVVEVHGKEMEKRKGEKEKRKRRENAICYCLLVLPTVTGNWQLAAATLSTLLPFNLLNLGQSHFFFERKQLLNETIIKIAEKEIKNLRNFIITKISPITELKDECLSNSNNISTFPVQVSRY